MLKYCGHTRPPSFTLASQKQLLHKVRASMLVGLCWPTFKKLVNILYLLLAEVLKGPPKILLIIEGLKSH